MGNKATGMYVRMGTRSPIDPGFGDSDKDAGLAPCPSWNVQDRYSRSEVCASFCFLQIRIVRILRLLRSHGRDGNQLCKRLER